MISVPFLQHLPTLPKPFPGSPVYLTLAMAVCMLLTGIATEPVSARATGDETIGEAIVSDAQPDQVAACYGAAPAASSQALEDEAVYLVNQIRRQHGLPPLKRNDRLVSAARFHAQDMALENYFAHGSHDRVNGQLLKRCSWTARISSYYPSWEALAENIAGGYGTSADAVQAWMDSPEHRKNILSTKNWEIGIGYYRHSQNFQHYWVQDFGRRTDSYPMIIDNEAPATESGDVTLYIYGDWSEYRLKVDGGAWGAWQPFTREVKTRIEGDAGPHRLYAELRGNGGVASTSDQIHLTRSNRQVELNSMPGALDFFYNPVSGALTPGEHNLSPLGNGSGSYYWRASVDGQWAQITPAEGGAGDWIKIAPSPTAASANMAAETMLITLYDASGSIVDMHQIRLSLHQASNHLYMPAVSSY